MLVKTTSAAVLTAVLFSAAPVLAQTPSNEELYRIIQQQQEQIEKQQQQLEGLRDAVKQGAAPDGDAELKAKVLAQEKKIEALADRQLASHSFAERTEVGGYGAIHYNNFDDADDQVDFHRFVLYFGHEFNDDWRFFSELEIEHAFLETTEVEVDDDGDGVIEVGELEVERTPGEVELEQAWVERDLGVRHALRLGLDLIPVGIINPTHEPTTFYGVERNRVESVIIPTTWREAGAKLIGRPGPAGLSYTLFLHSGLGLEAEPDFEIGDGRQHVAEATANDWAATGRIRYTAVPGLELAASLQYQQDVTQQEGDGLEEALLYEAHAILERGPFGLRALYAEWDFNGAVAEANGRDRQFGWYIEPSVKVLPQLGLFARYGELEEVEDLGEENTTVGLNYWPIRQIVLKADYQWREQELPGGDSVDIDSFNLGMGYVFP